MTQEEKLFRAVNVNDRLPKVQMIGVHCFLKDQTPVIADFGFDMFWVHGKIAIKMDNVEWWIERTSMPDLEQRNRELVEALNQIKQALIMGNNHNDKGLIEIAESALPKQQHSAPAGQKGGEES